MNIYCVEKDKYQLLIMDIEREYDNMQKIVEKILTQSQINFESEKRFSRNNRHLYVPDLYLQDGGTCGEYTFTAKSCIELKLRILPTTIDFLYRRFTTLKERYGLNNLYLIYGEEPETKLGQDFLRRTRDSIQQAKWTDLTLISLKDITETLKPEDEESVYSDWKKERKGSHIPNLIRSIKSNQATLFLGAGVGQSANLPSWNELLKKLIKKSSYAHLYEQDIDKISDACANSTLITARYLTQGGFGSQTLEEVIHEIFYTDTKIKYSDLMKSIVKLSGKSQIKSIITYNYDDLIDQHIPNSRAIYGKRRISNANEFPIYHVHGYVPQKGILSDSEVVLSEERYHKIYREVFDWSNVEQIYALTHTTCLFIGLSMSDPNLRRLLDIAKANYKSEEQDCPHYAFLRRTALNGCEMPCGKSKNEGHIKTLEKMFRDLGIIVIWYERHEDLPRIINDDIIPKL